MRTRTHPITALRTSRDVRQEARYIWPKPENLKATFTHKRLKKSTTKFYSNAMDIPTFINVCHHSFRHEICYRYDLVVIELDDN